MNIETVLNNSSLLFKLFIVILNNQNPDIQADQELDT